MPPEVYFYVREQCHEILSKFYTHICTPIEAPEKTSYGDIDILVCGPLSSPPTPISDISIALGAKSAKIPPPSTNLPANFAVPWPSTEDVPETHNKKSTQSTDSEVLGGADHDRFIQVDLETTPDYATFRFLSFTHAHSGFFTLLGNPLRKAGLVLNHFSLSLRIPSIEAVHRRNSTIPLTTDPEEILQFLGLDNERYWHVFASVEGMFEYAASCRLFTTKRQNQDPGSEEEPKIRHRTRHNHRRPLYVKWRTEFLPRAQETGEYDRDVPSRDAIREKAFETWPTAKGLYEAKVREFVIEQQREEVRRRIATEIPVDVEALGLPLGIRGTAVKRLKRIILDGEESYGILPDKPFRQADGLWDVEGVMEFVRMNWKEVGRIGMVKGHARAVEKKGLKHGKED